MVNIKFKYKIKEVAKKYNLPESVIEEIFNSQFKFYRETIMSLPIKTVETEEEFDKLKTTFYFKYLGKFFTTWTKIQKIRNNTINKQLREELENEDNGE